MDWAAIKTLATALPLVALIGWLVWDAVLKPRRERVARLVAAAERTLQQIGVEGSDPLRASECIEVERRLDVQVPINQHTPGAVSLHVRLRDATGCNWFVIARSDGTRYVKPLG